MTLNLWAKSLGSPCELFRLRRNLRSEGQKPEGRANLGKEQLPLQEGTAYRNHLAVGLQFQPHPHSSRPRALFRDASQILPEFAAGVVQAAREDLAKDPQVRLAHHLMNFLRRDK